MARKPTNETAPRRPPKPPASVWKWHRRFALTALVLLGVPATGHWYWGWRAQRGFAASVERLRAAGEPVDAASLAPPAGVPDAQNAALDLRAAAAAIDASSQAWKDFEQSVEWRHANSPTAQEWALIEPVVASNAKALALARSAAAKPAVDWQVRLETPMISTDLSVLNGQRMLASLLAAAALDAHRRGDDAEALRRLEELLFVGGAVDDVPLLISHLVAVGINSLGVRVAVLIGPDVRVAPYGGGGGGGGNAASREQVERVIAGFLDERSLAEGRRKALRGERVMHLDTVGALVDGKVDVRLLGGLRGTYNTGEPSSSRASALRGYAFKPLIMTDGRIMIEHTTRIAGAAEAAADFPAYRDAAPDEMPAEVSARPWLHPLAQAVFPSTIRFMQTHFRALTERRAAAVVLAARLYALDHGGQLPAKLDDLVPDYLPSVPRDALAGGGKPLGYVAGGASPRIYHVGENGVDDGGREVPVQGISRSEYLRLSDEVFHLKPRAGTVVAEDEKPD